MHDTTSMKAEQCKFKTNRSEVLQEGITEFLTVMHIKGFQSIVGVDAVGRF